VIGRGIIFDLDGTLAHTLPDIADAVNAALREFGLPERPESDVREWIGEGLPTLCRRALKAHPRVEIEPFITAVTGHYSRNRLNKVRPFPGIPELLDELAARQIPMAVLTNKPHVHTVPLMDAVFSKWSFAAIEGYKEEELRKPDPRVAWQIVEIMGLPREAVARAGDSFTDLATAVTAGLIPVGCTWGYRSSKELRDAGARYLINEPHELLNLSG
jgi:phosphoglycolate phosphatase